MRFVKRIFLEHHWIPFFFLAVYIAIPTSMYYTDGLDFAFFLQRDEFGPEGIHPHHPLFLPLMRTIYQAILVLIPGLKSMVFLQTVSAISGAAGIWFFMKILRAWGEGKSSSAIGGFFLGSIFGYWHFSTDASAYIPAFAIMLAGMLTVFSSRNFSAKRALYAGLICATAVLIHELAFLGVIAAGYFLFFNPDKKKYPLRSSLGFTAVLIGMIVIAISASYLVLRNSFPEIPIGFWQFVTSHADNRYFWTIANIPTRKLLFEVARSHTHLFFHLKPWEWVYFLNSRGDSMATVAFYRGFTCISAIVVCASIVAHRGKTKEKRHLLTSQYFWLLIVFCFTTAFVTENHFYRIFYLPPLIAIFGEFLKITFQRIKFAIKPITAIAVGAYFIHVLTMGILMDYPERANPFYSDTNQVDNFSGKNNLVVFSAEERYRTKYYRYFGKNDCIRITSRVAYLNYWDDIWPNRDLISDQTAEHFSANYNNVLITGRSLEQGEQYLLFSTFNLPGKHPEIMMILEDRLVNTGGLQGNDGYYYQMRIE